MQNAARYTNQLEVGHNAFEFLLNFGQAFGNGAAETHTQLVTSPGHAKSMWKALGQAIAEYEAKFGAIREVEE